MPSKKLYDLVQNDDYDTRIPLHPDEAFHHGITFQAKFIGMLDVPRPTSRVEIVAAMRRIRYDFKTKGVKKKKVTIEVSVDGVKVTLRKKKKRKQWLEEGKSVLLTHPIYRIFYVSHDSQDLKIFSYIARDGASNVFKCAVFKSNKKSQAMRIVRTVGQAFEVCHKLSINAPETDQLDYDEQETLTQDLVSDRLSDVPSDKPKKDLNSEGASDKLSLPDENCVKDINGTENHHSNPSNNANNSNNPRNNRSYHLDLLTLPTSNPSGTTNSHFNSHSPRKSPMIGDNYSTAHLDGLGGSGSCNSSIPASGSLSAHHEIQLLREQLEQQSQQTQAALAQLQLTREQLAAEQSARLEAQARTHQLLVHNRELLDHIAALVAHLQGGEKSGNQQQNSPHVTMPQQQQYQGGGISNENYSPEHQDQQPTLDHSVLQALGLNPQGLIENRAVTSCLPTSPLRNAFNPAGSLFNYQIPQLDFSLEAQLLQRLQALCGYTPPQYSYNLNQSMPFLHNLYPPAMVNNNYTLQPPPQKKLPPSPLAVRHSYSGSPILDNRVSPNKNDSMQSLNLGYQHSYSSGQNLSQYSPNQNYQSNQSLNQIPQQNSTHLQVQAPSQQQRQSPQRNIQNVSPKSDRSEGQFIKPLSQMGTLTTTDTDGRVRVIVPIPSADEASNMMSTLRVNDDFRSNVATITRSTSEKVPNRSELMSQVQRTAWARHTTK